MVQPRPRRRLGGHGARDRPRPGPHRDAALTQACPRVETSRPSRVGTTIDMEAAMAEHATRRTLDELNQLDRRTRTDGRGRHPRRPRRRPGRRRHRLRRRAARRPGGPRRAALRRSGGPAPRPRAGGGRASTAARATSPTPSSTSSTSSAASAACTSARPPARSGTTVVAQARARLRRARGSSWPSAPPPCWRSPAGRCRSPPTAATTSFDNRRGYITVHPSYLLRLPDPTEKDAAYAAFRCDLERIRAIAET